MDGSAIAQATPDELMKIVPDGNVPAQSPAPKTSPGGKRIGRPPGSKTTPRTLPPPPAAPAAPIDPALLERQRMENAAFHAELPYLCVGSYFEYILGYEGNAFELSTEDREALALRYRQVQGAAAALPDGIERRLLAYIFGSEQSSGPLKLAALALRSQLKVMGKAFDKADAELTRQERKPTNEQPGK